MHQPKSNNTSNTKLGRQILPISANGLMLKRDIYEQLKFAYAIVPRNTVREFNKVGVSITGPDDLIFLANIHTSGNDVSGIRMRDGKLYAFDVQRIINENIRPPKNLNLVLANAPFKFTDMVMHKGRVKIIKQQ